MHNVKCEVCGKLLGIITDEESGGTRVYEYIEQVILGKGGYIDGPTQTSGKTYCVNCKSRPSETTAKKEELK